MDLITDNGTREVWLLWAAPPQTLAPNPHLKLSPQTLARTGIEHGEAAAADGGHGGAAVALGDRALHADHVREVLLRTSGPVTTET